MGYSHKITLAAAFSCCVTLPLPAAANSKAEKLYQLSLADLSKVEITSATGNSTPLDKAPATASVITADEIAATGARTLAEVLETVPGLHVGLSTLSRLEPVYSIRGIHAGFNPHVLLLMNGVPVQFALQGGRPVMFRYPVKSIARVEVIRGPGSAIYGADAYSGVINIITKGGGDSFDDEVGTRAGSFGMRDAWVVGGWSPGAFALNYSVEYQRSDGDDGRVLEADLQTTFDTFFGTQASLAPGPLSTRYEVTNIQLQANYKNLVGNMWAWVSNDSGLGAGGAQALDYEGNDENTLLLNDITYQTDEWFDGWSNSIKGSYLYYKNQAEFVLFPPNAEVPIGPDGNIDFTSSNFVSFSDGLKGNPGGTTEDSQIDLVSIYTGWERHQWRIATGMRQQRFDSSESKNFGPGVIDGSDPVVDGSLTDVSNSEFVFVQDVSRKIKYVSLQDEWQIQADWKLTAGVRYDDYSDFGSTTNLRGALIWVANEKLTTKMLYGSAFRAPSFSEQFNRNNPVVIGNPNLNPEVIDTYELVANLNLQENLQSSISLFSFDAEDMIEYVPDVGSPTNTAQNVGDLKGYGAEWEIRWDVSNDLQLKGNYSWQSVEDTQSGENVAEAPQSQLFINAGWRYCSVCYMNAAFNWVAQRDRERANGDERKSLDDYFNIDLTLDFLIPRTSIKATLAFRNITDEERREPSDGQSVMEDFPLEGRSAWVSTSYQF